MTTYFGGLYESRTGGYYFRFPDFIDYIVPPTAPTVREAQQNARTALREYLEGVKENGEFIPRPMSLASAEAELPPVLQGEYLIDVLRYHVPDQRELMKYATGIYLNPRIRWAILFLLVLLLIPVGRRILG